MKSDAELLQDYATNRAEAAFAELVQRHINLVYAAALRQLGDDAHLAADVTQLVFTALARKAGKLARHTSLTGWLYTSVRFAARDVQRAEQRRRAREEKSHTMNQLLQPTPVDPTWEQLRPVLDEAMHELDDRDRHAVLLRYFEEKPFAEVGAALDLNENAARMCVERAVEKLRTLLLRRGVTLSISAAGFASLLASQTVAAAPPALAASVTSAAMTGVSTVGAGFTTTLMEIMLMTTKTKIALAVVVAAAVTAPIAVVQYQRAVTSEASTTQSSDRIDVILAQHVMLLNNRIVTRDDVEQAIKQHPNPAELKLATWCTRVFFHPDSGYSPDEAQSKVMALAKKYGISFVGHNLLGLRASARYDAIRDASDLVPDESRRVSGTVETRDGRPAAGAEVVLCAGTNDDFDVYLQWRRLRNRPAEVVTDTDVAGRFVVYPPPDTPYVLLILHPEGVSIVDDKDLSPARPIRLQAWTELQVTFEPDSRHEQYTVATFKPVVTPGHPRPSLHYEGSEGEAVSRFDLPAPGTANVQRYILSPEDRFWGCPPGKEINIQPGEALTVTLGPITETDLAFLKRQFEMTHQR